MLKYIRSLLVIKKSSLRSVFSMLSAHQQKNHTGQDAIEDPSTPSQNLTETQKNGQPLFPLDHAWLNPSDLEQVPTHYPMEQTSESFPIDLFSVSTILYNIASCLKAMSIQGVFFSDPVAAALLTFDHNIEMYLSLWLSEDKQHIIVEIQRRRGCSITFHKYSSSILAAISNTGDEVGDLRSHHQTPSTSDNVINYSTPSFQKAEILLYTNNKKKDEDESLQITQRMIQKEQIDSRLLGLEMLIILSSFSTPIASTLRTLACRAVIIGEGPFQSIQTFILNILFKKNMGDDTFGKRPFATSTRTLSTVNSSEVDDISTMDDADGDFSIKSDSDDENDECYFLDPQDVVNVRKDFPFYLIETVAVMFNLALTIFVNALEWLSMNSANNTNISDPHVFSRLNQKVTSLHMLDSSDIKDDRKEGSSEPILDFFLQQIQQAKKIPHNATLCIKGLRICCTNSATAKKMICDKIQVIHDAHEIGCMSHAMLQYEAESLLLLLEQE